MSNLQEILIETIEKDFTEILNIEDSKSQRKETNILSKRIDMAKDLVASNPDLLARVVLIEAKIKASK